MVGGLHLVYCTGSSTLRAQSTWSGALPNFVMESDRMKHSENLAQLNQTVVTEELRMRMKLGRVPDYDPRTRCDKGSNSMSESVDTDKILSSGIKTKFLDRQI